MPTDKPEQPCCDKPILIYTTFPSLAAAETVALALVESRLVACANIIPGMVAIYSWQGRNHRDDEVVMILKTRASLTDAVIAAIKARHDYENPAVLAIEVSGGSLEFFAWIAAQTTPPQARNSSEASP